MIKQLGGTFNNYLFPLLTVEAKETGQMIRDRSFGNGGKRDTDFHYSAKMYQDVSCLKVRSMGIERCTMCPLKDCQITECEAQGKQYRPK